MSPIDWVVLIGYLLIVLAIGVAVSRRVASTGELQLAGRRMPMGAVTISILATSLSAATFIGGPQESFAGNLTYLSLSVGSVLGGVLVAFILLPRVYAAGVTTVYEMLERDHSPQARRAAAGMFVLGRILASGARLYMAALPCALIVFGDVSLGAVGASIAMVVCVAIVYTSLGGIRAVIWTDVMQTCVFVVAAVASVWVLWSLIGLDVAEVMGVLREAEEGAEGGGGKLRVIDTSFSLSERYTIWTALLGVTLLNAAAYGTDQDLVQRMLTCRSARKATWSLVWANVIGVGMVLVFLVIGLLLYVGDQQGVVRVQAEGSDDTRAVFLRFILNEMPVGLKGLMLAGVFAAAMSSLDSALNAIATVLTNDFGRCDGLARARLSNVVVGCVLAGTAFGCAVWQTSSDVGLLEFALGVMVYPYAGLLGVFVSVLVLRRGSTASIISALVTGVVGVLVLQYGPGMVRVYTEFDVTDVSLGWRMLFATAVSCAVCAAGGVWRREGEEAGAA